MQNTTVQYLSFKMHLFIPLCFITQTASDFNYEYITVIDNILRAANRKEHN